MEEVYLLLGANLGKREENLARAKQFIAAHCGKIIRSSSVYETAAWGKEDQQSFLNQALQIETSLSPLQLLAVLKEIEKQVGRTETEKWGPRIIDIDILFFGNKIIDEPQLKIPHPFLHERKFTLVPLCDIAPRFLHQQIKKTVTELLSECTDRLEVLKKEL